MAALLRLASAAVDDRFMALFLTQCPCIPYETTTLRVHYMSWLMQRASDMEDSMTASSTCYFDLPSQ